MEAGLWRVASARALAQPVRVANPLKGCICRQHIGGIGHSTEAWVSDLLGRGVHAVVARARSTIENVFDVADTSVFYVQFVVDEMGAATVDLVDGIRKLWNDGIAVVQVVWIGLVMMKTMQYVTHWSVQYVYRQ